MQPDLWQQAKQALAEAMSLDGQARADYLQSLEKQSHELAAEVQALVTASMAAEEEHFLGQPVSSIELDETVALDHRVSSSTYNTRTTGP